jgi:hypothetical protein
MIILTILKADPKFKISKIRSSNFGQVTDYALVFHVPGTRGGAVGSDSRKVVGSITDSVIGSFH